ncbi:hypothetical protein [Amycolatopsis anabasis]|uniref:hypothetical protein n=1 Tax=Amycolatopsis anabasis TaxID=1840409 RepID=UPI00131DB49C|nr:hypothetical protein [Amycolatopsis anabasis]
MDMTQFTQGQQLAAELRSVFRLLPQTRWYRLNDVRDEASVPYDELNHEAMWSEVWQATCRPESYRAEHSDRVARLAFGFHAMRGWLRCVTGNRSHPVLCSRLQELTPWQFAAYLGRMADTGITGGADFEAWFRQERERLLPGGQAVADFAETATGEPSLDEGDRVCRVDDVRARILGTVRYISSRGVVAVQWDNGALTPHAPAQLRVLRSPGSQ